MKVRVSVEGLNDVVASILRLGKAGERAAKAVFKEKTDRIVRMAKPLTPVEPEDGGALRDSVRAARVTVTKAGRISAAVVAGGAPLIGTPGLEGHKANVYAEIMHNDVTLHHAVGGPFFIERPFMQIAPQVPDALMAAMDKETRGEGV